MKLFIATAMLFSPFLCNANDEIPAFGAQDLLTQEVVSIDPAAQNGIVVVFLSAHCPCSNSHTAEIARLAKEYPNYFFVGVHSNQDETLQDSQNYFKKIGLPFRVLEDKGAKIANIFGALKTPHSYVLDRQGKIQYQGGVSSSQNIEKAEHKFLREALEDISAGRALHQTEGRTLGCAIAREAN
ncbi:MAG: redoxin domain-containing protein [Bdellovibrionales bacterium]